MGVTCQLEYFIEREKLAGETSRYNFIVEITVMREVTKLGRLDLSEVASYVARPFKLIISFVHVSYFKSINLQ